MRTIIAFFALAGLLAVLSQCKTPAPGSATTQQDAHAADRARSLEQERQRIGGKSGMKAEEVYQNIKVLKGISVDDLLSVMDHWGEALGESCDYCHVPNEWQSEVKPEKSVSRDMVGLLTDINTDLGKIPNLGSYLPSVSCYTCHRGQKTPSKRKT